MSCTDWPEDPETVLQRYHTWYVCESSIGTRIWNCGASGSPTERIFGNRIGCPTVHSVLSSESPSHNRRFVMPYSKTSNAMRSWCLVTVGAGRPFRLNT